MIQRTHAGVLEKDGRGNSRRQLRKIGGFLAVNIVLLAVIMHLFSNML